MDNKTKIEDRFSQREQLLIALRWYERMTPDEIATVVGASAKRTRRNLRRIERRAKQIKKD